VGGAQTADVAAVHSLGRLSLLDLPHLLEDLVLVGEDHEGEEDAQVVLLRKTLVVGKVVQMQAEVLGQPGLELHNLECGLFGPCELAVFED
jgi:hypothetical protein